MVIVKGATRARPSEMWIEEAKGYQDSYGEPFELIELIWNNQPGSKHKMSSYAKTRGFEDAVIETRNGNIRITYRPNGSAVWAKKNGIGSYKAYVPKTLKNLKRLANNYRDNLWTISDARINNIVKEISDKIWDQMPEETVKFNEARIKSMHTGEHEKGMDIFRDIEKNKIAQESAVLSEERRELAKKKIELERLEAELRAKHKQVLEDEIKAIPEIKGSYTKTDLQALSFYDIKKLARKEFGMTHDPSLKHEEIIEYILTKQAYPKADIAVKKESVVD